MEIKDVHEKILYPVTRVRAADAGGSGVMIYSEPDIQNPGQYINIALTCQHVVDKNIVVKDEWDTVLKREVKKDVITECAVELFDYDNSRIVSANSIKGQIIAYDKNHDLAAIKLNSTRKVPYVSTIIPRKDIDDLKILNITADQGPTLKRFKARARGRGTQILKRTSHITVTLTAETV